MADDLVNALLEQVRNVNDNLVNTSAAVKSIQNEQTNAAADMIVQAKTAGENAIVIQDAKNLAEQKAQKDTIQAATNLGTNPDDAAEIMSKLQTEWKDSAVSAMEARKKLKQAMDTKFLDSPVDYVVAQFKMEGLAKDADAATARKIDVENSLTFAQQQTQQAAVTANALKFTMTDGVLQASTAEAQAKLNQTLDAMKIQNSGINLEALDRLSRLDQAGLNATSTGVGIQMQVQQLAISKANLANSTASLQLALEDRQFRLDERKQSKEELEGFANYVKSGAAVLGFKDVVQYPTNKIIQLINTKDPTVMSLLNTGIQTQLMGQPVIAENAGIAARNISQVGAPLRDDQKVMKTFFTDVWQKAASPEGGIAGRYDNTKLPEVTKAANSFAIAAAQAQKNDIKFGDNTNIYSAPPLQAVMGTPGIQNSEFYKKVFAQHMAAGGLLEFNPEQLTAMTLQAIKSGTINYNTGAAGLQSLFNAAKLINNSTRNYVGFGLPFQDGYRTKMIDGSGATRPFDLTKEQDINQLLNSRLTSFRKGILDPFANRGQ